MSASVIIWLCVALAFGVAEASTAALVSIWMAVGALASAVAAALQVSLMGQIVIFLLVSALLLACTAPLSKKFRHGKRASTNADRVIGMEGVVVSAIDAIENKGQIKIMGQIWSATSKDGQPVEEGEKVIVLEIEGAHAVVEKKL